MPRRFGAELPERDANSLSSGPLALVPHSPYAARSPIPGNCCKTILPSAVVCRVLTLYVVSTSNRAPKAGKSPDRAGAAIQNRGRNVIDAATRTGTPAGGGNKG